MRPFHSYMICTSPRSGSTLLCHLLRGVGCAGSPDSHFHQPSLDRWLASYGLRQSEYDTRQDALKAVLRAAIARGKGASDIFGLRMQQHSFGYFAEQLKALFPARPSDLSRIQAAFGPTQIVYLNRENKLDQAISCVLANQTGLWHRAGDGTELERLSEHRDPVYDRAAIARQLAEFEQMHHAWQAWFAREQIRPIRISYDALSADPFGTLGQVLDALGLDQVEMSHAAAPVAKLADATNRDWAARFRAETP